MPSIALPTPRNDPAAVSSRRKRLALGALLAVVVVGLLLSATFRHDLIAFARRLGVSGAGWLLFAATTALTLFIAALSLLPVLLAFWWLFLALFIFYRLRRSAATGGEGYGLTVRQQLADAAADAWGRLPRLRRHSGEGSLRI